MVDRILGSRPNRAGFIPPNIPAIELAADVEEGLGDGWADDVGPAEDLLGVDLPSFPSLEDTLARDGGLGDGPSL